MAKRTAPDASARPTIGAGPGVAAPYESALNKALDKLTSEVLVFLLAYVILVIALVTLRERIPETLAGLLYVIPVLGIVAYAWLRKRTVVRAPHAPGVSVRALFVKDAYVGGVRGPAPARGEGPVDVSVGIASGSATAVGVDAGAEGDDARYLGTIFRELTPSHRRQLIASATQMLERQKPAR
jgi:hypothetical protein